MSMRVNTDNLYPSRRISTLVYPVYVLGCFDCAWRHRLMGSRKAMRVAARQGVEGLKEWRRRKFVQAELGFSVGRLL
jgi:hypothetical protein